jgi:hypothetical protein
VQRRAWILAVSLAMVAALAVVIGFFWRRSPHAPAGPSVDASAEAVAPPGTDAAVAPNADGGSGDAAAPSSPYGAAVYYADQLGRCFPSRPLTNAEYQYGPVHQMFGHETPSVGVTFQLTANGELRGAKLLGAREGRPCLTAALARLPVHAGPGEVVTVQVPLRGFARERRPAGDVQLFMTGGYFQEEFSEGDVAGDWRAICVGEGRSFLVPAPLTVTADDDGSEGPGWNVESRACPGPDVLLVKGPALAGWRHEEPAAHPLPDAAAGDAGDRTDATDAGATDRVPLATLSINRRSDLLQGVTLTFGNRRARLWVYGPQTGEAQALILESGSVAQVLIDDGNLYEIVWAGDLDGDGRPDFVVSHTPEFPHYDLFLSSHAGGGRLVRRAAGIARMGD